MGNDTMRAIGVDSATSCAPDPAFAESGMLCDGATLVQSAEDAPEATDALIDFIQQRYHDSQLNDLEELLRLAQEVDLHGGSGARSFYGAVGLLLRTRALLTAQIQEDESFLFPMMLSSERPRMTFLIH
ncbi:hypothetical protein FA743_17235 [Paracoccus gahaiensis]|uniref:Uncharacterized protein n=1 Tax=Paracoccus gahaiensis TaxID=1706839 RepID=A0A4U0R5H8_9RHOB|nr:hypothetical protein [Paracoccus gahaiensis]TJZ89946.1 hypothetical protein FA743_17235 [Paracoccus gahaiensis]